SLKEAARFSGLHPSLFAKLLQAHAKVAITTLENLSKTQARQFAKTLKRVNGLPWKILILIDSTLQHRASLHPENTKTFNHGKGYVIGHQWTNIVLLLGDMLIPLVNIRLTHPAFQNTTVFFGTIWYNIPHETDSATIDLYLRLCARQCDAHHPLLPTNGGADEAGLYRTQVGSELLARPTCAACGARSGLEEGSGNAAGHDSRSHAAALWYQERASIGYRRNDLAQGGQFKTSGATARQSGTWSSRSLRLAGSGGSV